MFICVVGLCTCKYRCLHSLEKKKTSDPLEMVVIKYWFGCRERNFGLFHTLVAQLSSQLQDCSICVYIDGAHKYMHRQPPMYSRLHV